MSMEYFSDRVAKMDVQAPAEVIHECSMVTPVSQANIRSEGDAADRDSNSVHSDQDGQLEVSRSPALRRHGDRADPSR